METQETLHVEYLEQMSGLINDVAINLLNIDPGCRDHINDAELKDFNTYIVPITEAGRKYTKPLKPSNTVGTTDRGEQQR